MPAETFDLGDLVRDAVVDALPLAREKQQDPGWDGGGPVMALPVIGYPAFLYEALSSPMHNATRYTPAGGRITAWAAVDGDTALVYVDDTGPGTSTEERAHTFQCFRCVYEGGSRQGKPKDASKDARYAAEGSGLGLTTVRAYAARSGGYIELADGEPNAHGGVGLSVRIRVPLVGAAVPIERAAMQQPQ